jgi:hypothetical protein
VDITITGDRMDWQYEIETPACIYSARTRGVLFDHIQVLGPRQNSLVWIKPHMLRLRYDFKFADGRIYRYRKKNIWKGVSTCVGESESYSVYAHKGFDYSVFQNDSQIAAFTAIRGPSYRFSEYEMRMNDDANLLVMVSVVLTMDAGNYDTPRPLDVTFGRVEPQARAFDKKWLPT